MDARGGVQADDLEGAAAERYWVWKDLPDGDYIHRQLTTKAPLDCLLLRQAARRKSAGLDVRCIARMFREAAIRAELERVTAARKARRRGCGLA